MVEVEHQWHLDLAVEWHEVSDGKRIRQVIVFNCEPRSAPGGQLLEALREAFERLLFVAVHPAYVDVDLVHWGGVLVAHEIQHLPAHMC